MFQVVVSDLDGTLLRSDSTVDAITASTLREVQTLGVELVIATARHYLDVSRLCDNIGIHAYLITANGARVHDPNGTQILAQDIDPAVARALMSQEISGSRLLSAFADEGWLVNRPCPELDAYFRGTGFASQVRDLASHSGQGLAKVMYMDERDSLTGLEAEVLERFRGGISVTYTTDKNLEIMAAAVSKKRALHEILHRLDVPASAVVAFGDGENDIEMLSMAGRPYVMTRSSPKLLAALPQASLAGSNDQAGVAHTLRELFGLPG